MLQKTKPAPLLHWLERVRNTIVQTLQRYITDPKSAGLAEALLIGYKNDLDKELLQSYSDTGVVHIIAISGLHLGIIYWILRWLTRALPQKGAARWWRFVIILSGMWIFSLLAGAQPSVLRSAVMFSFILVAESIRRRGNIYNTLCCSAFFLLLFNPFWLWDLGFQLSYLAVLSLILFYATHLQKYIYPFQMA
ncbi:MAG: ComEC/Rec2 family competence protein [Chitinophagaceae bacterium]|nr:ComEC/Rec2 family competence protein [Chitinophagaceae bacterium]